MSLAAGVPMSRMIGGHPQFLAALGGRAGLENLLAATGREVLGVFHLALDPAPFPRSPGPWSPGEEIIVMAGFTGDMQGVLSLHSSPDLAFEMAAKRLGMAVHDFDSRVREMLEELGDAVANHFRAKLQNLGWRCSFSPPAVISGSEYHFHTTRRSQYVACAVIMGGKPLWLTLGLRRAPERDDLLDRAT